MNKTPLNYPIFVNQDFQVLKFLN